MKKQIAAGLLIFLLPLLFGCDKHRDTAQTPEQETAPTTYGGVVIDVSGDESGYWSFMAESTTLDFYGDELINVFIEEPTLLAFKVPDRYPEGIGVIDGKKLRELTEKTDEFLETHNADSKTRELLTFISRELNSVALFTSAST